MPISDIKYTSVKNKIKALYDCLNTTGQNTLYNILVDRISIIYNLKNPAFKSRNRAFS